MSGHTPGPWEVDDCGNICADGAVLASVHGADDFPCLPEDEIDEVNIECCANARLIAAAPELLTALETFVRMDSQAHEIGGGQWNAAVVMGRAAIAKAKGGA